MGAGDQLDGLNAFDLARVYRIAGMAAIRSGQLTTRQKNAIDRIAANAKARRDKQKGK
jgi:hypothetical protein